MNVLAHLRPGSILPDGSVLTTRGTVIERGEVWIKGRYTKSARKFGWTVSNLWSDNGLCQIRKDGHTIEIWFNPARDQYRQERRHNDSADAPE